jgi:NAD(P)-dependent dehydrogenase (short-subunit alcohol dehydrogenase family)
MRISYTGKSILVTGGTSGIGRATAIAFAEAGGKVVITGRREREGAAVVADITKNGGTAAFVRADVANDTDVEQTIDFVLATHGHLDIAFNNAGVEGLCPLTQVTKEKYISIFDVNVWGVLNSMKHEVAAMLRSGGGAIVNSSSISGHVGAPGTTLYAATKHAVEGMTRSVALEFATQNVRVNAVAPGAIVTDMTDRALGKEGQRRQVVMSLHPVRRFGTVEEVAAAVLYLASDAAKFTTGATLLVDGGWTAE